ncbi:MAG: aminotransferase class V-fold PLP-dependent enzyme [Planctomycetes bacterium]|nr:aminotransferase class V-fold PLP-dependent enzyme [Planctomycetota bacterium]
MKPTLGDRSLFADLGVPCYFNHAAMSPPSRVVREACGAVLESYARRGAAAWFEHAEQRDRLRARLAALIGARAEDIALVPNTTQGVVDIALSFGWAAGDRVVVFDGDFPTNVTPWQRAAERFGLEVLFLPSSALREAPSLPALRAALERGVRLVALSAVEFQTGFRTPLRAVAAACREHGAELFVDAIQAVGIVPVDVVALGVDYLVAGGHKWLMGLEGSGMLYVAPTRVDALRPAVAGWLSHEDAATFLFAGAGHLRYDRALKRSPTVFEGGVMNSVGFAALEAAVDLLLALGVERIHAHVQTILEPLEQGLVARGFQSVRSGRSEERSGILSVLPPAARDLAALHEALAARGVACATPDGHLRFAPHWPNDRDQVPDVLRAVDAALADPLTSRAAL